MAFQRKGCPFKRLRCFKNLSGTPNHTGNRSALIYCYSQMKFDLPESFSGTQFLVNKRGQYGGLVLQSQLALSPSFIRRHPRAGLVPECKNVGTQGQDCYAWIPRWNHSFCLHACERRGTLLGLGVTFFHLHSRRH